MLIEGSERRFEYNKKLETDLSNPRYKLLLMDFHGTIVDRQLWTMAGLTRTWKDLYGIRPPINSFQTLLDRNGNTLRTHLVATLMDDERIDSSCKEDMEKLLPKRFNQLMKEIYMPMPGMRRVMRKLLDHSIEIAILTNGPQTDSIRNVMDSWGLSELNQQIYNGPVMNCKKPDPESVEFILKDFDRRGMTFSHEEVLVIGDQVDDTQVAFNAGVDSALIIRPIKEKIVDLKNPHPTYVVDNPFDLIDVVAGSIDRLYPQDSQITVQSPFFH